MAETKFTDLDFSKIKENLKTYLKSQSKFQDYNFEGSGLSILLDILAYNTAYNGFYLNMLASEMFLDSASQRDSVVSRAKHLGYLPSSRRGLQAVVDVEYDFSRSDFPLPQNGISIRKTDVFKTFVGSIVYTFSPKEDVYARPIGNKKFLAENVRIVEGKVLKHQWTYQAQSATKQRFIIPNKNVDLSTLSVYVKDSETSSIKMPYQKFEDLNSLGPDDRVYFLEEASGEKYEIIFGDGVLGKALSAGNIIMIEYLVPTNDNAIGCIKFLPGGSTLGYSDDTAIPTTGNFRIQTITGKQAAKDYSEKESIESIKFSAPRMYDAQNRAVTKNDYETLLKKDISFIEPKIQYLRVWGGEENDPPEYGKVFCAIKPYASLRLNNTEKLRIIEDYIRPKSMLSLQVEVVEPEYIGMTVSSTVNYFSNRTVNSLETIRQKVVNSIKTFRDQNISGFDSDFRLSKLSRVIDAVDPAIESNITKVTMKYQIRPDLTTPFSTIIKLSNQIDRGDALNGDKTITSTLFYHANVLVMIGDDGKGNLGLYISTATGDTPPLLKIGTVDYLKGTITINKLIVDEIPNEQNYINIFAKPRVGDIISYKNQIILLSDEDIDVSVVNLNTVRLS